jgi:hypothetical protein
MSDINIKLFAICKYLHELGIATSDNQLSRLMNKSPRYMSWVRATDHDPDIGAMTALYVRLDDLSENAVMRREPDKALQLTRASHELWNIIKEASITRNYHQRKRGNHEQQ